MYAEYFGLKALPFENTPSPEFFFLGGQYRPALASLVYGLKSRKGLLAVTGPSGCGKTTLSHAILKHLPENVKMVSVVNLPTGPFELLKLTALELDIPDPPDSPLLLAKALRDRLLALCARAQSVVLVLDEAQSLTKSQLDDILFLSNMETTETKLCQILLLGRSTLASLLNQPEYTALRQRTAIVLILKPLDQTDASHYINFRLRQAGSTAAVFTPAALSAIFAFSGGIPRIINKLCDLAMLKAFLQNCLLVDEELVEAASLELGLDVAPIAPSLVRRNPKAFRKTPEGTGADRDNVVLPPQNTLHTGEEKGHAPAEAHSVDLTPTPHKIIALPKEEASTGNCREANPEMSPLEAENDLEINCSTDGDSPQRQRTVQEFGHIAERPFPDQRPLLEEIQPRRHWRRLGGSLLFLFVLSGALLYWGRQSDQIQTFNRQSILVSDSFVQPDSARAVTDNLTKTDQLTLGSTSSGSSGKLLQLLQALAEPQPPAAEVGIMKTTAPEIMTTSEVYADISKEVPKASPQPPGGPPTQTESRVEKASCFYTVQIATVFSKVDLEIEVKRFRKKGLAPYWITMKSPHQEPVYRIMVGVFALEDEAKKFLTEIGIHGSLVFKTPYPGR